MKKKYLILLIGISVFICGCISSWQAITKTRTWKYKDFEIMLPEGWARYNLSEDMLELTKDGSLLQNIRFFRYEIDEDELPNTKKKLSEGLLLEEVAEIFINELSADQNVLGFTLIENTPLEISGKDAFKLVFTFHNEDGLDYRAIRYGFRKGVFIYFIQYVAAQQYYFDKDAETFAEFIRQFKVKSR